MVIAFTLVVCESKGLHHFSVSPTFRWAPVGYGLQCIADIQQWCYSCYALVTNSTTLYTCACHLSTEINTSPLPGSTMIQSQASHHNSYILWYYSVNSFAISHFCTVLLSTVLLNLYSPVSLSFYSLTLWKPWAQLCAHGVISFFLQNEIFQFLLNGTFSQEFTPSDMFYHDFRNHLAGKELKSEEFAFYTRSGYFCSIIKWVYNTLLRSQVKTCYIMSLVLYTQLQFSQPLQLHKPLGKSEGQKIQPVYRWVVNITVHWSNAQWGVSLSSSFVVV